MNISDHVLHCFLTLAETCQFTVAAERCHMTQSALSQLISRLEERVGVRLFHRDSRSVALTADGMRFAESARRIKAELDQALSDLKDVATLHAGVVALAAVPSLAVTWLPSMLSTFKARYPGVRLHLHDVSSIRCLELVQQGLVDFALNSQPGTPNEVVAEQLFDEALYVVCPPDHPLAQESVVSSRSMRGVEFLHLQGTGNMLVRTATGMAGARSVLRDAGVVDTGFEVSSLSTLAGLVAAGFGVCLSPESSLPQFSLLPTVALRIDRKMMSRPIYCIQRKAHSLGPAAQALRDLAVTFPHPSRPAPTSKPKLR